MDELTITIRDELLAATDRIQNGEKRVLAICRLSQNGRYKNIPREKVGRAVFHACLEALKRERDRGPVLF
ncbi:hypothetical protein GFC01_05025 [Desulfofundulus thermobenzoicus]|uniref:Uncharacterized protein n=1 Tax=Desulfofundulus thermobenzoicus TaxID=29376 RepID=A0A6N7INP8_9FIRM|nr:hypothetical protein [Desulfofundulus thermobenzoicus]MQL51632.1 hypothetical protein [Desulfofundulus thermobenzoicus]